MAKYKLVCDRCGFELTEPDPIELAMAGCETWQNAQRGRGEEPRGVFPCKFYFQCHGELIPMTTREAREEKKSRRK